MKTAQHGDIRIAYEVVGPPEGRPLLLISATDAQMVMYPAEFCAGLVAAGFQVVRFDNRDAGLSTHLTGVRAPAPLVAALRPSAAPYRLTDMAGDAVAVLDAMGWESAHVAGTSMGGMIAQTVAIAHPGRVRSLTSISSTPSVRIGTRPPLRVLRAMTALLARRVHSAEEAAEREVAIYRLMGSPGYPPDEDMVREIGRQAYDRHPPEPESGLRQRAAIAASGDRRKGLAALRLPALVIHGDADVMMRPKAGRATAAAIPGARLVTYPGMGHDLPRPLWPAITQEISRLAQM